MKKLIVFDLDGTLALSKSAVDAEMGELLSRLLGVIKVAIISGGDWPQFQKQVLASITHSGNLNNLSILPACGTKYYKYVKGWEKLYEEDFTAAESKLIFDELNSVIKVNELMPNKQWGSLIEDRGSQITYSGLGQVAPLEEKKKWDPDFAKRKRLKLILDERLPGFAVRLGGATSIDVTRGGIDKAYGITKLQENLLINPNEMLFVGDALFNGGNDQPVRATGVPCIRVRDPEETKYVIETILAMLG